MRFADYLQECQLKSKIFFAKKKNINVHPSSKCTTTVACRFIGALNRPMNWVTTSFFD